MCIRLIQVNNALDTPILPHAPVFALGIVLIPVFDTLRVFSLRIWKGKSPFQADKTHIHHLLTSAGFTHGFTTRFICSIHGFILIEVYWLRDLKKELILLLLIAFMLIVIIVLKNMRVLFKKIAILPSRSLIEN
jgi:UDP-N-acetylmuramyl pentapeptide phosphotransferase/UDP-N-acetylglucosamine-1-phosphate transferase